MQKGQDQSLMPDICCGTLRKKREIHYDLGGNTNGKVRRQDCNRNWR
jgi:hypothetical protein